IKMNNGSKFHPEALMLVGLHRMAHPIRCIDLVPLYGRDWSQLSRAFNYFHAYVIQRFDHLISDAWDFWSPSLESFTEHIMIKIIEKSDGGIVFPPGGLTIFGFLDDTIERPGAGPSEVGENAQRLNQLPTTQAAYYNGYKHHHKTKFQTVELPNGMCSDLYGPKGFRHADTELVTLSNIGEKLRVLSEGSEKQYKIYGD
ncbi:hypothetical protein B484DRAFT_300796, partial [Ochromonadaceae sp. CCMP2298]